MDAAGLNGRRLPGCRASATQPLARYPPFVVLRKRHITPVNQELISLMKRRVARLAADGATLRNQGAAGVVQAARAYLMRLDLSEYAGAGEGIIYRLDEDTRVMCESFPPGAQSWGGARKVLNLFLRDCLYNAYLSEAYGLHVVRQRLEVPVDSQVAAGLIASTHGLSLPAWPGLKRLSPAQHQRYQEAAALVAKAHGVARVDIDLWLWRQDDPPLD